ncbi:MAG: hypothetical protein WD034_13485 [Parvibaculum sp.]|jgi:hypothetical protein|uniref:hypothetical protein n=1 Tax=Parvibaculum sp. TaxID=2024848 RepID=UPI0034A013C1
MEWMERLLADPALPQAFLTWLIFINSLAVFFFFSHFAARAVLAVWLANLSLIGLAFAGGVPALSHVLLWTPLLLWLIWRNPEFALRSPLGLWLVAVFASNLVGLAAGYAVLFGGHREGPAMLAGF